MKRRRYNERCSNDVGCLFREENLKEVDRNKYRTERKILLMRHALHPADMMTAVTFTSFPYCLLDNMSLESEKKRKQNVAAVNKVKTNILSFPPHTRRRDYTQRKNFYTIRDTRSLV